jgi:endonuclease YncB( thermonuclease family)
MTSVLWSGPSKEGAMRKNWFAVGIFAFVAGILPVFAGDSILGKITEVRSADLVTLDNGSLQFQIRIIGIDVPKEGPIAERAKELVNKLVLDKNARARIQSRMKSGEMVAKLFTDGKEGEIQDVGVELVRAGFARRQRGNEELFDYKYGELSKAEAEARRAKRGLWASGGGE